MKCEIYECDENFNCHRCDGVICNKCFQECTECEEKFCYMCMIEEDEEFCRLCR